jgi:outer membrane protein TolC
VFLQITENDKIRSELEIRNMVLVAYGNILVAEKNAEILKENKENLEQNAFETKQLYENGFVEEQDADQIELLLSTVTNSYEQAVRYVEITKNQLNFVLGIDIGTSIELKDELEQVVTDVSKVELLTVDFDISNHIDYQIVENQERASELLWKQQKATYLPSVSAFYSYQQNSFSNNFDFFNQASWFPSQIVGLNLNVPIFTSFGRSSRVQQSKIDFEKVNIAKQQVQQQLEINIRNARSVYSFSLSQYKTAERNLELASRIYRKTKIKYDEGISTSLDLNQVSNQLLENQSNYINAALSLINAKSELNKALNLY